ncbi:MAG: DNA polymerase IV [Betaproteobacteria bacterium]|nr:DNA polymerase IV [Betaproteobacteria bacterium]
MNPTRIAHLDMDAFYASVELLRYPELRGRPVVIGGRQAGAPLIRRNGICRFAQLRDYAGRGVVTTCTYEARALGVSSGMGLMKAARLAPDAILLPADFEAYRHYSARFKAAVSEIAPKIENRGIDEIYIDLTDVPGDSRALGHRIQQAVLDATGLSCSIGITPNKLLSKICSDLHKPNGLTLLDMAGVPARIWPLPVERINGIGPKATAKLAGLGIATIADLAQADPGMLQRHFGPSYASWLHRAAHGEGDAAVITHSEPKSISRETTFERDLHPRHDRGTLSDIFTRLCWLVAEDLRHKGYCARTIGIKLRFDDFRTVTRDLSLPAASAEPAVIRRAAGACLKRVRLDRRLRLLGVRASGLCAAGNASQADLPLQGELAIGPADR